MAEIYIVELHGGEYEDRYKVNLKAFSDVTKADMYLVECEEAREDLISTMNMIREWLEEFEQSYPQPVHRWVEYPGDTLKCSEELDQLYEEQKAFLQPVYDEAFRQDWAAWFEIWYPALEGKLQAIGKKPYVADDNRDDPRTDERNFGYALQTSEYQWYAISTVDFGG